MEGMSSQGELALLYRMRLCPCLTGRQASDCTLQWCGELPSVAGSSICMCLNSECSSVSTTSLKAHPLGVHQSRSRALSTCKQQSRPLPQPRLAYCSSLLEHIYEASECCHIVLSMSSAYRCLKLDNVTGIG